MPYKTGSLLLVFCLLAAAALSQSTQLAFSRPADAQARDTSAGWMNDSAWLQALPVGNGSIGAMVFGDVPMERLQLNEKSLWSGSADDNDNPEAVQSLAEIRRLLFAGEYAAATALTNKTQVCKGVGSGQGNGATAPYGCFQTLGDLWLNFADKRGYTQYSRGLDLVNGIAFTNYTQNKIRYQREVFSSFPDQALVVRLTANAKAALSFSVAIDRPERFTTTASADKLVMKGVLSNGKGGDGMQYEVQVVPVVSGGTLKQAGKTLVISKADAVTLIITAATDYELKYPTYKNPAFREKLFAVTRKAIATPFAQLRSRHLQDFSEKMNRSWLRLGDTGSKDPDFALYSLYYQYGRYLLLSSSRAGSLPANLQGMWTNKIQTPWNCDYHTDINVQMNYWPAELTNLADCQQPLTDLVQSLVAPGTKTAQVQYHMKGWCVHPITNVWGYTAPGEHPSWGLHVGATGWMARHLWEHYAFTQNKDYLAKVYPTLKGACEFYFDWLVKHPVTGKWVSGPASSPENAFVAPDGSTGGVSMGPSHDQEVIHDLFRFTSSAAAALSIDSNDAFLRQLKNTDAHLAMPAIGSDGRLMEWAEPFQEVEPNHRHVSHLYALHPGDQIGVNSTPDLAQAVRKSLDARGDDGTGWSLAWKVNFWARLHDGDRALKLLKRLLQPVQGLDVQMNNAGGTYPNLFCAHPPFQIDGNFGGTAGIAEMLLQSHEGEIELLPALPASWSAGKVKGLCARGGFELDIEWAGGRLKQVQVTAKTDGECRVRYGNKTLVKKMTAGQVLQIGQELIR